MNDRTPFEIAQRAAIALDATDRERFAAWFADWHYLVTPAAPTSSDWTPEDEADLDGYLERDFPTAVSITGETIELAHDDPDAERMESLGQPSASDCEAARVKREGGRP